MNVYPYPCYTTSTPDSSSTAGLSVVPPTSTSPTTCQHSRAGRYFSSTTGTANTYLGSNMNHSNLSSLMAMQQHGGYVPQPTHPQLAMFHQQLKDRYGDYASQLQPHAQQTQQTQGHEGSSAV
ncbi:hypothetical protein Ac2012v2_007900 [Leucoagaricus gongylophorus]